MNEVKKKYFYRVYGLTISSEIELDELISYDVINESYCDVYIILMKMNSTIKEAVNRGENKGNDENSMWFHVPTMATFKAINGNIIEVELIENVNFQLFKVFLLGRGLATILIQRNQLSLQGGAVDIGGKGIIFMGQSGAGKSTLINSLIKEDNKMLADDLVSIKVHPEGNISILPSYPLQRLCEDAIDLEEIHHCRFSTVDLEKRKLLIPTEVDKFQNSSTNLRAIIHMKIDDVSTVKLEKVQGGDKLKLLVNSVFRKNAFKDNGIPSAYFKQCIKISKEIPIYELTRPLNGVTLKSQMELIKLKLSEV